MQFLVFKNDVDKMSKICFDKVKKKIARQTANRIANEL